jgi:hypothetical protein
MVNKIILLIAFLVFCVDLFGQEIETEKYLLKLINQKQVTKTAAFFGDYQVIIGKVKIVDKENKKSKSYTFEAFLNSSKEISAFKFYCKKTNRNSPQIDYDQKTKLISYRYLDVNDKTYKKHEENAINAQDNASLILSALFTYQSFPY